VRDFALNLTSRGGCPMTWDGSIDRIGPHEWSISLDFAEAGDLAFRCSELELLDEAIER
jgi:hypothetical protein